jgi:transposase
MWWPANVTLSNYHILKDGVPHKDLGIDYFDKRKPEAKVKRLVAQIAKLGFEVTLQPIAKAA